MLRFCLATSYDDTFTDVGEHAAMTLRYYGRLHGHTVRIANHIELDRPPAWHRVIMIKELFDEGFDYVFWMDADAVFSRYDEDIRTVTKNGKDLYLVEHDHPNHPTHLLPNTGVMLVRNSDWSRRFFRKIWESVDYINHPWWENAALLSLLGYNAPFGGEHNPNSAVLEKVAFLPECWNHIPSLKYNSNPIITHLAGFDNAARKRMLPREVLKSLFLELERQRASTPMPWFRRQLRAAFRYRSNVSNEAD